MSVYRRGGVYWYDFWWQKRRHRGSTKQVLREDAELLESQLKLKLRRASGGIAIVDPKESPAIIDWAEVYYDHATRSPDITRPERIEDLLRVVLRFWGRAPKNDPVAGEPYHDLRLLDPIVEPMWVERFERWMAARRRAGQTRNQYRSVMSQMYKLAMSHTFTAMTGVQANPFVGVPRDHSIERTMTLSLDELRAWLAASSYHVRLAIAIAALAPKLRLKNVLSLRWPEHIDARLQRITIAEHKTAKHTRRPLVAPINAQLRAILQDARDRNKASEYVVTYRSEPIASIRGGLKLAAARAGLTYGRTTGVTFHTIRHTMATMLAELGEPEALRKDLMGHLRLDTTQRYTHIRPEYQTAALERLSAATPILDLVTLPWRRARGKVVGKPVPLGRANGTDR